MIAKTLLAAGAAVLLSASAYAQTTTAPPAPTPTTPATPTTPMTPTTPPVSPTPPMSPATPAPAPAPTPTPESGDPANQVNTPMEAAPSTPSSGAWSAEKCAEAKAKGQTVTAEQCPVKPK